jgi:glycerophosphoryl diester phosphodiesterase
MKKSKILFSIVLFVVLCNDLHAQLKDVHKIINYLRHPKNDLVAVCAHRGYWRENNVPENSLAAIQRAVDVGIETIELDIKLSSDGVPVLSHDLTLGRCTNATLLHPRQGNNPPVKWFTSGDLQKLQLRDKRGVLTNQHLPTFEQAMDYIRNHTLSVVVVLDIKDQAATKACWEVVKRKQNAWGTPAYDWVIFKLNATIYGENPSTLENHLNLGQSHYLGNGSWSYYSRDFKYIPVFTTNMYNKLNCLQTYKNYRYKNYFVAVEVDFKQNNGIHSDIVNQANRDNKTLVCFNALPDAGGNRFWKADYSGTYRLQDIYYTAPGGSPRDTDDRRGSWQWLVSWKCRFITTDEPVNLINDYLKGQGKRNTNWYTRDWARVASESDTTIAEDQDVYMQETFTDTFTDSVSSTYTPAAVTDSLFIFPNPTDGILHTTIVQQKSGYAQFDLVDASGAPVYHTSIYLEDGLQDITVVDLKSAGVKAGIYLLQVTLPDSRKQILKRIVVR